MDREKLIDIKDKIIDKLIDIENAWVGYKFSTDNSELNEYLKERRAKRDAEKAARRAAAKEAAEKKCCHRQSSDKCRNSGND